MGMSPLVYTNKGFEAFLQQAETSGISKKRQHELIVEFLGKEVTFEDVLKENVLNTIQYIKDNIKKTVLLFLLCLLMWYLWKCESNARSGFTEYQPWQFELSAFIKKCQQKALVLFDWTVLFHANCLIPNPAIYWRPKDQEGPPINCYERNMLPVTKAINFEGYLGDGNDPPFVVTEADKEWKFGGQHTLKDIHKWLLKNEANYPCAEFDLNEPISSLDPLGDLINGTLYDKDKLASSFTLIGCTKLSNRLLRKITDRPLFMDGTIESTAAIIAIATKHIPGTDEVDYTLNLKGQEMWVAQIIGNSKLEIYDEACPDTKLNHTLKPGSFVTLGIDNTGRFIFEKNKENFIIIQNF